MQVYKSFSNYDIFIIYIYNIYIYVSDRDNNYITKFSKKQTNQHQISRLFHFRAYLTLFNLYLK